MNRNPVHSSQIRSIGYDAESQTLEVEFNSGSVYRYADVPPQAAADLVNAPSIGTHFGKMIKEKFATTKRAEDGTFVALDAAKASKASVSLLKRRLQEKDFWHEGQERPPHAMFQVFKATGTKPANMTQWFDSLLQSQCSKAIEFLGELLT